MKDECGDLTNQIDEFRKMSDQFINLTDQVCTYKVADIILCYIFYFLDCKGSRERKDGGTWS